MEQEKFVVSARKYRPMGFEQVVGQEHITTTLQNAIDNQQLAQALLFCGPRGVGKTTCARIVARKVNGFEEDQLNALNIYELDAASNNSVDDIRNLIDQVRYPPQQGKYKVYIIDEVHMLSNQAFNAFLKTLEEPPSYAIFILATTEKHKVIPTILSRCQIFDFNRIQVNDTVPHLRQIAEQEGIEAEEEALNLIAQKADGALRDALSIFDLIVTFSSDRKITYRSVIANLHILDYDYYFKVTNCLLAQNLPQVMLTFDEIIRQGFDGHNFIVGLSEHFRNLMVCKDASTVTLLQVSPSIQQRYLEQAQAAPLSFLLTALNIAGQCNIHYKSSKNQRLHVELALMKMNYIQAAVKLASLPATAPSEEKKKADDPAPAASTPTVPSSNGNGNGNGNGKAPLPHERTAQPLTSLKSTIKIPKVDATPSPPPVEKKNEAEAPVAPPPQALDRPIVLEELREKWSKFAEQRKLAGNDSEYLILNQHISLKEDGVTVPLTLMSPLQEDTLNDLKPELLQHLRRTLGNAGLRLEVNIVREQKQRRPYTPAEKFNFLMDKYPQVKELKERLALDPDF